MLVFKWLFSIFLFVIVGCHEVEKKERGHIRFVHASIDSPEFDFSIDGRDKQTSLDYAGVSPYFDVSEGDHTIGVVARLAKSEDDLLLSELSQSIMLDQNYTLIVNDNYDSLDSIIINDEEALIDKSKARVRFTHSYEMIGELDVYFDDAEITLESSLLFSELAYRASTVSNEVAITTKRLRITLSGSTDVVFDSGELSVSANDDVLFLIAQDSRMTRGNDLEVIMIKDDQSTVLRSASDPSQLRLLHTLLDNNAATEKLALHVINDDDETLNSDIEYTQVGEFSGTLGGEYTVRVNDEDQLTLNESVANLVPGYLYTAWFTGDVNDNDLSIMHYPLRTVAPYAALRVFHAAVDRGNVDLYLLDSNDTLSENKLEIEGLEYQDVSDIVKLSANHDDDYELVITPAGSTDILASIDMTDIENGSVYSIVFAVSEDDSSIVELVEVEKITADN